jgi:pyruvate/2-oxoacid:ferredoxin oxidoreductase beta subunit
MSTTPVTPKPIKTNRIGLQILDYRGGKTTLCAGCGHNAISERITEAFYEMGVQPERVLVEVAGIFHVSFLQLQLRAWTHAVGCHRRFAGEQDDALDRRQW